MPRNHTMVASLNCLPNLQSSTSNLPNEAITDLFTANNSGIFHIMEFAGCSSDTGTLCFRQTLMMLRNSSKQLLPLQASLIPCSHVGSGQAHRWPLLRKRVVYGTPPPPPGAAAGGGGGGGDPRGGAVGATPRLRGQNTVARGPS